MNRLGFQLTATFIRGHLAGEVRPDLRFDMSLYSNLCGTAGCLAFFTIHAHGGEWSTKDFEGDIQMAKKAGALLSLSEDERQSLFLSAARYGRRNLTEVTERDVLEELERCLAAESVELR